MEGSRILKPEGEWAAETHLRDLEWSLRGERGPVPLISVASAVPKFFLNHKGDNNHNKL